MIRVCWLIALLISLLNAELLAAESQTPPQKITFVCEHGVAKSVIAAALFNREAAARGLNVVAQARGIAPEETLQAETVEGLRNDGLDVSAFKPTRIVPTDVEGSRYVITLGVSIEPDFVKGPKLREWNAVPPVSKDYGAARDAISAQVVKLISELEGKAP